MKDEYIRTHRREDSIELKLRKIGFDKGYCIRYILGINFSDSELSDS
jgi:hypothetical protein